MKVNLKIRAFQSVAGGTVAAVAMVHGIHACTQYSGIECLPHIEFGELFVPMGGTATTPFIGSSTAPR